MTTLPLIARPTRRTLHPRARWLLAALAFPPAGLISHAIAGHVDTVGSALLGGAIAGAGIGAVHGALLQPRVIARFAIATAAGLAAGLATGASAVDYRTDAASLAVMGAISGAIVGLAQALAIGVRIRTLVWAALSAGLWALGWTVTNAAGVDVEQQWTVFGAAGAVTVAALQSLVVDTLLADRSAS